MRQAAQVKLGYYPIPPSQMAKIAGRLRVTDPDSTFILDPCCGEGDALKQLGGLLGVPERNLYACELSDLRTERAKALMPAANFPVLPDSDEGERVFHGCALSGLSCTYNSFPLVYLNPPFDDELGGGRREELTFLAIATNLLMSGTGILVMVAPFKVFNQNRDVCRFLDCHYEDAVLTTFDGPARRFGEAVLFARRRKMVVSAEADDQKVMSLDMWRPSYWARPIENGPEWALPVAKHPVRRFTKSAFTPDELIEAVRGSKLCRLFEPPVDPPLSRPGMKLGAGHQALLVTSGFSDGVIRKDGEPPFVVRGTVTKEEFVREVTTTEHEKSTTVKTVISENMVLFVRCIDPDGNLFTFTNSAKEKEKDKPAEVDGEQAK